MYEPSTTTALNIVEKQNKKGSSVSLQGDGRVVTISRCRMPVVDVLAESQMVVACELLSRQHDKQAVATKRARTEGRISTGLGIR